MPAYFVAIRNSVHDADEMDIYRDMARAAAAGHSFKRHASYGRVRSTEGEPVEGAVILEFPTFEAAEAWYDSPEYQAAMAHRRAGADYRTFIIDGI
ncbi:DUF1330 domain-containing protein [Sphingobium lactosutens]|uniref:DUF1330 domain-containing protein n=1 Tax=Sphingobium lactosutens DS20 TaxID=1331060 RepID=T0HI61_9SPHN|nr:DUF1330 domain-containing protein [Sphingobium lactosutens]EQB11808.1 hypothetical protein RLDS_22020 [Sphingobium lactosutens DS20]